MAEFNNFYQYNQILQNVSIDLNTLRDYAQKMNLSGCVASIDSVLQRLSEDTFSVAIVGEFKRGKSTVINSLLCVDILPTSVLPCSATLNKITYGMSPSIVIEYKNGKTEAIEIDQLENYVTKLTKDSTTKASNIKEATIYYPVKYCKNRVTIIDTPGLNDEASMTEVTLSVLPQIDAAIMVIMATSPFSDSERDFLESKIITSDLGRVMFVVNGIDHLDEEDIEKILKHITEQIQEHILKKVRFTYGENSKEYENNLQKLGNVKVYGISAKKALKAKLQGDDETLEKSRFPVFENALERFLTEERGAISLSTPINRIKNSSLEIIRAAELQVNGLSLSQEEFEESSSIAHKTMINIREHRDCELDRIDDVADCVYNDLLPDIDGFWSSLEYAALSAIENYYLEPDDLKKNNLAETQEMMLRAVSNSMQMESQRITENIQNYIETAILNEAERLHEFEQYFFDATENIRLLFSHNKIDVKSSDGADTAISLAASVLSGWGIGGFYQGYREAGGKGALLGGLTGVASMVGVGLLIGALSLPLTWPVVIIGTIVGGVIGTFGAKSAVRSAFKQDKLDKFKEAFKENVLNDIYRLQSESNFESTIKNQIDSVFDALKNKINQETEHILKDTENQLQEIKFKVAQNVVLNDKEKDELKNMINKINEINERASIIGKQITNILSR